MCEICTDNRFELIAKYKARLIEATNIETSEKEMEVIDNILFRFWQMKWLDRLEKAERKGEWTDIGSVIRWGCPLCHHAYETRYNYCPNCGADMRKEGDAT